MSLTKKQTKKPEVKRNRVNRALILSIHCVLDEICAQIKCDKEKDVKIAV